MKGDWWFEQEYLCRFVDAEGALFPRELIDAAFGEDFEPQRPHSRPNKSGNYTVTASARPRSPAGFTSGAPWSSQALPVLSSVG